MAGNDRMGLVQAAQQLGSYGRGPDRQLAHISPDESEFLDYMQGGRRTNPHTGLPEYSLFGKILKAVARVAGAVGGFALAGPAGAALGAGAATKLTGGSWKDALKGAALSGIGGYATQGLTGGGWSAFGSGNPVSSALAGTGGASAGGAGSQMALSGLEGLTPATQGAMDSAVASGAIAHPTMDAVLSQAVPNAAPSGIGAALAPIGGYPAAVAGLGALSVPINADQPGPPAAIGPPPGFGGNINLKVAPMARKYQPYTGDYAHYGEPGGGGQWQFFDDVNPKPQFLAAGGGVSGPRQPGAGLMGIGGLRNPGIPSQIQSPLVPDQSYARSIGRDLSPAAQRDDLRRAAILGYVNAKNGGAIYGPGTETSDSIPAMLSKNENVVDAGTIRAAGNGNVERGHHELEKWKQKQRKKAGVKNPRKPPAFQGAA